VNLMEWITEILDDEYGESALCIVKLILAAVADDIERIELNLPSYTETRHIHSIDYISYTKGAKDEHAYIVKYLRRLLDN